MLKKIYKELAMIRKYLRILYMETETYKNKDLICERNGLVYTVKRKEYKDYDESILSDD